MRSWGLWHTSSTLCLVLLALWPLYGQQEMRTLLVSSVEGGLNVYYGGKLRLAAGYPHFQSKSPLFVAVNETNGKFLFQTGARPVEALVRTSDDSSVLTISLSPEGNQSGNGGEFIGFFFDRIPDFQEAVTLWRYKPWNSWTKPLRIREIRSMADDDVQFMYWKYADGLYAAAVPLSGRGYRTTLGQDAGRFGSKSLCYFDGLDRDSIPQLAVGFGTDPYTLISRLYEEALSTMGKKDNLRKGKTFPAILETMGWCSWNGSDNGRNLNGAFLLRAAKSFTEAGFPIGWFLVDDGWIDQTAGKLNSFEPDSAHFPHGFKDVIRTLKVQYHLKDVGVWHAFDGYWQGINPDSPLGREFHDDLLSWKERIRPEADSAGWRTCFFLSPYARSLGAFYDGFHRQLKDQGFTFIKVDNQLVVERMARGNFPLWDGAENYHAALNASVARTFDNTMINCMDMTADAYLNFGGTPVARAVEDYFPYQEGETYDLQRGNAAAHVLQAVYNALYFSQMVYPDFDMFQSHNPNAVFHAVARALNCGPIYITDNIGEQKFDVLFPLLYADGKIIRSDTPLLPTEDCLFQLQDAKPFKAFSMAGRTGLLGIWNCADAERVEGEFRPSDVHPVNGEQFALYEYFGKQLTFARRDQATPVSLGRLAYKLYYVIPLEQGNAVIGLVNKYNAPATVLRSKCTAGVIDATVYEGGQFAAVASRLPAHVSLDGMPVPFVYRDKLLLVNLPSSPAGRRTVRITFD